MPFQSEKQRRYLHANHPEIANRWEAKYGLGGIAELNSQLNSLPEYYLPKNHGGLIPSHEAGIYGLAEGGVPDIGFSKVKPSNDGSRPGYFTAEYGGGGGKSSDAGSSSGGGGGEAGHLSHNVPVSLGGTKPDTVTRDAGDAGHLTHNVPVSQGGTKPDKVGGRNMLGDYDPNNTTGWKEKGLHIDSMGNETNPVDRGEMSAKDYNEFLTETVEYINPKTGKVTKYTKQKKFGQPYEPPKKKSGFWGTLGNIALALIPGLLPAKLATGFRVGKLGYDLAYTDKYDATIKKFGFNKNDFLSNIKSTHKAKEDLYKSLPDGHPEKIALQAELEIGKKTTPDGPDGEGGVTQDTSITMDVEKVNDAKTQLQQKYQEMDEASYEAWLRQQEMQAKKEAYLQNFRQMYMFAQGGRVPAGYNTGGLSNLFRLKNV